ncbi:MAG: DegV family EDD domain-containing protein [Candidatus Marinimicrobia bacterium]|nr:DegV family EDD domain-containing protein [Candidatus Neomarinimicrobiota bacterium]
MKITILDGKRFRLAVIAAAKNLIRNEDYLNKINVFPVPDGDTGTNMAATLHAIVTSLRAHTDLALAEISRQVSDTALDGARGNSGSILAQFFYGLATELVRKKEVNTREFAQAAIGATRHAYQAMADPKEGTILSVIRVWGETWEDKARESDDFAAISAYALKQCRIELKKSPSKLKLEGKMKYVDSGGLGFVNMLEGINEFIESPNIRQLFEGFKERLAPIVGSHDVAYDPNVKYRFCTECLVDGRHFDRDLLRDLLLPLGDSLILAGSTERLKLHIHTNAPETVFSILAQYGTVRRKKAEDMKRQVFHRSQKKQEIALVVDSASDISDDVAEKYNINIIPLRIAFGDELFIDGVTIDNTMFYERLKNGRVFPKTSQPAPRDMENMYRFLLSHYKHVISLHVSGKLSGTYQNAIRAASRVDPKRISVLDTQSGSIAQQIMAIKASQMIARGSSVREILDFLVSLHGEFKMIVMLETVKYAVKGGRLKPYLGGLLRLLGLIPLITITENGETAKEGIVARGKRGWNAAIKKFRTFFGDRVPDEIGIIHANCPEKAAEFETRLRASYPNASYYCGEFGPVIGTYAGPGAIVFVGFSGAAIPKPPPKQSHTMEKIIERLPLPAGGKRLPEKKT